MSSIVVAGDTSGSVTLSAPAVANSTVLTLPSVSGSVTTDVGVQTLTNKTLGNTVVQASNAAPAFSAYMGGVQTISTATFTKLAFNTKVFDTNTNYDAVTNYRFTPTVAGYYQVNGGCRINQPAGGSEVILSLYKNGAELIRGADNYITATGGFVSPSFTYIVSMNGSTDYIELWIYQSSGVSQSTSNNVYGSWFQASMVRSA